MTYLPCEFVETNQPINASVIWLHGLGASGHDFVPIVPELKLPESLGVRFVFPHAPSIPVTINNGMVMPAWFDILSMEIEREIDTDQIMKSSDSISALIEREISKGISSERIVIAGFSQGGAVAYQTALSYDKPLAGLMTLSTYFATQKNIVLSGVNKSIPIQIFHGIYDPMVPVNLGQSATDILQTLGYNPEYKTYPIEHEVNLDEIRDISQWLQKILL